MKNLAKWTIQGTFIFTAILTSSCSSEMQSKNLSDEDSTTAIPVEAASVQIGDISAYYSSTATLEAEQEAMVVAKVRGIVKNLAVEEGDYVNAGKVLATLEDEQLSLEAEKAKATMDRLNNELKRKAELYNKNLVSAQEFENAKYEFQAQKSAYKLANLQLEYSQIKAPINGIISDRLIKVGNMIDANQEVFKITDFDPLLAVLNVPEHEMDKLQKGQQTLIQVDAIKGKSFEGRILRIGPTVNPETGTFEVTVTINDKSRQLKPGMFARVRIVYDTHQKTLMIPKNAVITEDGNSSVYVIKNKLTYHMPVHTGYVNGNDIEILQGLTKTDTVVTIGQSSLRDSSLVEIVSF